ncbi:Rogdi leucine zipper containing protein-domain-containing protein [Aspergillus cavernicola]|uniref:Rogdi leucine zipper containing protein-domain-containing protein n=1 Tax=Aspergillus cavernicola TaxID=176166 RepID=A0ABR4I2Z1_9EURO
MATWVYPPLAPERLEQEADSALERELEWLLRSLQDSLASLREGLHECAALLAPKEPGSTLVLSSLRSENVKGFVTRVGTKVVKGDIQLRLNSLSSRGAPVTRLCLSNSSNAPELVLNQLVSVRDLVNQCLDIVDVSTWTGDPLDARFIYSQLHLLGDTIAEGQQMLKGESDVVRGKWSETSAPENIFEPPLPPQLSFHLSIADSALVLYLRTLESSTPTHTPTAFSSDISLTGFSIRDRLFGTRQPVHDESGDVFLWKGDEVKVREKIRVESQDPSLMSESDPNAEQVDIHALIDKITTTEAEILELLDDLDLTDEYSGTGNPDSQDPDDFSSEEFDYGDAQTPDARVRMARHKFGEILPDGYLNETETLLYTRLYGEPIIRQEEIVEVEEEIEDDQLFREDGRGGWEEVPYVEAQAQDDTPAVYDMEQGPAVEETDAMQRTREVAEQLGAEILFETFEDGDSEDSKQRLHPLTVEGKSSTDPNTVFPPKTTLTGPISTILSDYSNKHIAETAQRAFGGTLLPQSTTTPPAHAQVPQLPIGLDASSRFMSEMEANAYLAVLYPGLYASTLSVLTEIRKRLGSDWLRPLISQEGGPSILDAGAGGAGILAWRDILRAEYELMVPDYPKSDPYPLGRSTVVTGSDHLRLRASIMLENTTFLPRLPDYIHAREKPTLDDERTPKRKQFDIIIAPHSLLGIEEEFLRKEYVENLWALLNPNGGVLVLMEKGHQKGFEAIAGAREMLLKRHISSPGSTEYSELTESSGDNTKAQKEPGMIIAPCTNHERCPMYHMDGHSKGRKDFCHFEQRYIRPAFHQRIIGAKDRNHEDLKFSYLAVQRGVDLRVKEGIAQGTEATDAAFEGYEDLYETPEELETPEVEAEVEAEDQSAPKKEHKFHTLSLPRVVYTPMKRRGHVIFDVCTPAGKIERWTVPRSYSRQAYKDARKSSWGDLWALGAKTRIPRTLKLGDKHGEGKKERLARRAAAKTDMEGEHADPDEQTGPAVLSIPTRRKGERIPSWKKHADKKKVRQASRKYGREDNA